MSGQSALILGATGATGRQLLAQLLSSPHFACVGEYGRRVTSPESLDKLEGKEKLEQTVIDFEKLESSGLNRRKWDVVYITLGTTRASARTAQNFEKFDREYVINAARAAKSDDAEHKQRIIYVSSGGANPSSMFLYTRSKGLTEQGLANLGYSDTIVFRPSFLDGANRQQRGVGEAIADVIAGALSYVTSSAAIHVGTLAKSVYLAGKLGTAGIPASVKPSRGGNESAPFTVIGNAGALQFAKLE